MIFTRKKARLDANPESPPRTHPEINICKVRTPSQTFFAQEQNELFVQQVLQCFQDLEGEVFHYRVLCLKESSTEDDLNNPIVNWLFNITLTKISIHIVSAAFCMIN